MGVPQIIQNWSVEVLNRIHGNLGVPYFKKAQIESDKQFITHSSNWGYMTGVYYSNTMWGPAPSSTWAPRDRAR